jgi:hypothetical protein
MSVDKSLQEIMDNIPERDQQVLYQRHKITDLSKLVDVKSMLQQRALDGVCSDVQMVLEVLCTYLESLEDPSKFTWEGFESFCDFKDASGSEHVVIDLAEEVRKRKANAEDNDPDGYNLTAEERKQMEQLIENDPLTMKIRGFSARTLQFEMDMNDKKSLLEDTSEKTEVAFNGSVYYKDKCYYYQQPNGETVTVGIRKFTSVRYGFTS